MAMNSGNPGNSGNSDADRPGNGPGPGEGFGDGFEDGFGGGFGDDDERLGCGRMLSEVWDAGGSAAADTHLARCPYCSEALGRLTVLGDAVREAGRPEAGDWDAAALTARVMDVVRLELRPGRPLPLGGPEEDLWVMEAMAAKALRRAAESVPGVRAGSCRVDPAGQDRARGTAAGAGRGPVHVRLEVVAPFAAELPALADEVRRRVRAAADIALGVPVAAVDVTITDLVGAAELDELAGLLEEPAAGGDGPADGEGRERS